MYFWYAHHVHSSSHIHIFACTIHYIFKLKLTAMCAGIGAPGTLREILRGYFGDKKAPERFRDDDVVKAGFITIVSLFMKRRAFRVTYYTSSSTILMFTILLCRVLA